MDLKSPKNVYLVDFGLACHHTTKDEFTPDPKKAHDGTPEYTSRDAHQGGKNPWLFLKVKKKYYQIKEFFTFLISSILYFGWFIYELFK